MELCMLDDTKKDQSKVALNNKKPSGEDWDNFTAEMRDDLKHGVVDDALNSKKKEVKKEEPKEEPKEPVVESVNETVKWVSETKNEQQVAPKKSQKEIDLKKRSDDASKWAATSETLSEKETVEEQVDYLKDLNISLDAVVIVNPMDDAIKDRLASSKKQYLSRERTVKFVALNSGYSGEQTSVPLGNIDVFKTSDSDHAGKREMLYSMIWKSIVSTNINGLRSKFDFETFLKVTSILDVDMLLYGIYRAAEIKAADYNLFCNNAIIKLDENTVNPITDETRKKLTDDELDRLEECRHISKTTIDAAEFMPKPTEGVYDHMMEIIYEGMNEKELLVNSPMMKVKRFMLETAKVVIDIKPPTLYDHLAMLKETPEAILKGQGRAIQYALFSSSILFPDVDLLQSSGGKTLEFIPETRFQKKVDFFLSLKSFKDVEVVKGHIENLTEEYFVPLKTPEVECGRCGQVINSMQIDIEDLLVGELYKI